MESWVIYDPQGFLDKDGKVIEIIVTLSLISMLHRKVIDLKAVLTAAAEIHLCILFPVQTLSASIHFLN